MTKEIRLNAFDMNCVGHIQHGMWTHPRDRSTEYNTIQYWQDLARLAERGKFDGIYASRDRKEWFKQCVAELFEFASRPDLHLTGAASRDLLEVGELDLECDCAAANPRALAVTPNLVDDFSKRVPRRFVGE